MFSFWACDDSIKFGHFVHVSTDKTGLPNTAPANPQPAVRFHSGREDVRSWCGRAENPLKKLIRPADKRIQITPSARAVREASLTVIRHRSIRRRCDLRTYVPLVHVCQRPRRRFPFSKKMCFWRGLRGRAAVHDGRGAVVASCTAGSDADTHERAGYPVPLRPCRRDSILSLGLWVRPTNLLLSSESLISS